MNSAYFDVHDILADDQRMRVKFMCSISWSGLAGSESLDAADDIIDKYSVVELPLFLAIPLIRSPFANGLLPRAYSTRMRSDLNANAANVPLKDYAAYFYAQGAKLLHQFPQERLSDLLYTAFIARLMLLTRPLQCTTDIAGISPLEAHSVETLGLCAASKMDQLEYSIFQLANMARKQYDSWQRRDILRLRNECEQWEE